MKSGPKHALFSDLRSSLTGTVPKNEELLRQISQITLQIPPNKYLSQNLHQNMTKVRSSSLCLSLLRLT
jgi:hypothetical protein